MSTTFEDVRPIVEGRLFEWGRFVSESPDAPISSVYRIDEPSGSYQPESSQEEAWVIRHWDVMAVTTVVERALRRLSKEQRLVLELRYKHRHTWEKIAGTLHVSTRTAYRIRDEALLVIAYELDLFREPVKSVENPKQR